VHHGVIERQRWAAAVAGSAGRREKGGNSRRRSNPLVEQARVYGISAETPRSLRERTGMSLFYGLAAGLFVSGSTWAAMTYISHIAGICLGLFLLTFFVVSTVYLTGDDLVERQRTLLKALTNTEVVFF
jgi:hypothetical protein